MDLQTFDESHQHQHPTTHYSEYDRDATIILRLEQKKNSFARLFSSSRVNEWIKYMWIIQDNSEYRGCVING